MNEHEMKSQIISIIDILLKEDEALFKNDADEISITLRFAIYIQRIFKDWDIDCEYNKYINVTKKLKGISNLSDSENGTSVYPDIIIHKRMTKNNFLVIEVKKTTNKTPDAFDIQKIEVFKEELKYQYGLFIRFKTGNDGVGVDSMKWV